MKDIFSLQLNSPIRIKNPSPCNTPHKTSDIQQTDSKTLLSDFVTEFHRNHRYKPIVPQTYFRRFQDMDYQTIQKIIMAILLVGELIVGSGGDNTPKGKNDTWF
ncbi:MAG: hypothetical protein II961_02305 [Candidatus Riflebacteria bacterium]|nr:hypothetical protein [Candidatus Riflebacteria bacterium]